jgi:type IV fimbrial biogenesis protein FimT
MSHRIIIIKSARGVTTLELIVTVSIMVVLLMLATPSIFKIMDKQRLTGACHEVYQQLTYARSTAAKINKNVSISFKSNPFNFDADNNGTKENYGWCVGLNDTSVSGCNCAGSVIEVGKCKVNGRQEVVRFAAESNVRIYNNDVTFGGRTKTTFNARDGMAAAGHVSIASKSWACKITLSSMGRVRFNKTKNGLFVVPTSQLLGLE